jgi:hypothetical protein
VFDSIHTARLRKGKDVRAKDVRAKDVRAKDVWAKDVWAKDVWATAAQGGEFHLGVGQSKVNLPETTWSGWYAMARAQGQ